MIVNERIYRDDVYSFTDIVKYVIKSTRTKSTLLSMIEYFIDCGIIERIEIDYGYVKKSVYEMNKDFGELIKGHWITKRCKMNGVVTNGTLYFSEFGAKVLTNIYLSRNDYCIECMKTKVIYDIIVKTAIEYDLTNRK